MSGVGFDWIFNNCRFSGTSLSIAMSMSFCFSLEIADVQCCPECDGSGCVGHNRFFTMTLWGSKGHGSKTASIHFRYFWLSPGIRCQTYCGTCGFCYMWQDYGGLGGAQKRSFGGNSVWIAEVGHTSRMEFSRVQGYCLHCWPCRTTERWTEQRGLIVKTVPPWTHLHQFLSKHLLFCPMYLCVTKKCR